MKAIEWLLCLGFVLISSYMINSSSKLNKELLDELFLNLGEIQQLKRQNNSCKKQLIIWDKDY